MQNRAIFNEFKEHSYTFVLYENFELPLNLGDHDVRVDVRACAVSCDASRQAFTELFLKKPKVLLTASSSFAGVVNEIGSAVTRVRVGNHVAGILPLDADSSACSDQCIVSEFNLVVIKEEIDFESVAACVGDGVKAYTALHHLARLEAGETVLILDAATGFGSLTVQLALAWAAKVIAVVNNGQERSYLEKLEPPPNYIIEVDSKSATLVGSVMEETGKLGVNIIIDNGVRQSFAEDDKRVSHVLPTKHDIISCLAVGGRWVTSQYDLQLDPPNSLQLYFRSASLSFVFDQSWTMSSAQQGRWLHIVEDIVKRLETSSLKAHISHLLPFSQALEFLKKLELETFGRIVVQVV